MPVPVPCRAASVPQQRRAPCLHCRRKKAPSRRSIPGRAHLPQAVRPGRINHQCAWPRAHATCPFPTARCHPTTHLAHRSRQTRHCAWCHLLRWDRVPASEWWLGDEADGNAVPYSCPQCRLPPPSGRPEPADVHFPSILWAYFCVRGGGTLYV